MLDLKVQHTRLRKGRDLDYLATDVFMSRVVCSQLLPIVHNHM